jgi:mono/diheme cytochrome c family protein
LRAAREMGDAAATGVLVARRALAARGLGTAATRKKGQKRHFGEGRGWRALLLCAGLGCLLTPSWAQAADPKRGEPMYQRYCSGCHGVDGRGGGKVFMPHVGALNRKGHTELLDDGYVASIITEGGPAYGKSGYMPSFKGTLSPEDIADVIAYVRTFPQY